MTVRELLKRARKGNIQDIIENYNLQDVEVDMFYNRFGVMTKQQMIDFILDAKNGIALSRFGHGFDRITIKKSEQVNSDGYSYGTASDHYESNNRYSYECNCA